METAAQLDRPAVEGIEESLLSEFGEAVLDGRTKQMIGHMVRQIMENRGYVVAQQNVKVTNGAPFTRATRYKKPDCVTYHVHRNIKSTQVLGLTQDREGGPAARPERRLDLLEEFQRRLARPNRFRFAG